MFLVFSSRRALHFRAYLDIGASFSFTRDSITELLDMSLHDVNDIEKTAGVDSISPAETMCDAGLQSARDTKIHITRGMHSSRT